MSTQISPRRALLLAELEGLDPICESPLGKLWVLFKTEPRHPLVAGSGFVVRLGLFGRYQTKLIAWEKAGRPHVCGK